MNIHFSSPMRLMPLFPLLAALLLVGSVVGLLYSKTTVRRGYTAAQMESSAVSYSDDAMKSLAAAAAAPSDSLPATPATLELIRSQGNAVITQRLEMLAKLGSVAAAAEGLTEEERAGLKSKIANESDALSQLKTALNKDSGPEAQGDFTSIYSVHHVYGSYVPLVNELAAASSERLGLVALTHLATKIKAASLSPNGQKSLESAQSEMNKADASSSQAMSQLLSLPADAYPGDSGTLQAAGTALKDAQASLDTARNSLTDIANNLHID